MVLGDGVTMCDKILNQIPSQINLKWPYIPVPNENAWMAWKKYICQYIPQTKQSNKVRPDLKLGRWLIPPVQSHKKWEFYY